MIDPVVGVPTTQIQWFSNGVWKEMPHRYFFANNIRCHFKNSNKHMTADNKRSWAEVYKRMLLNCETIVVNHIKFRVVKE